MHLRRFLTVIVVALASTGFVRAQNVNLTEAPLDKRCVRNELAMELEGKISIKQDGKEQQFPHSATARHVYIERFLDLKDAGAERAARHYTTAESAIRFNNDAGSKRTLRAERRFLVAHRFKDHMIAFSPNGNLTREEMELTEHLDTMAIPGLLPGKEIAVGKRWSVPNGVVAALCEFDGLTGQNLEGKLEALKDHIAHVTIAGTATGINLGAEVKMLINAKLEFDTKEQRIVALEWKETDQRQQGPITPALSADVTIKLKRTPIDTPEELSDFALVKVPAGAPPAEFTGVHHQDKRYTLRYARDWHVVSPEDSPQFVLRLLERGDFIGQATITPWKKVDPKEVMTIDQFAAEMAKTPGWVEEKELERKEVKDGPKAHQTVYRVAAQGELDGSATIQYYYLVMGTSGEQLIVTFSVVPKHVQRLGARDVEMIRELVFPEMSGK